MEIEQKAIEYLDLFRDCKFSELQHPFLGTDCGMGFILIYLGRLGKEVTAKELSRQMDVSMARITSLVKKMEERALIIRTISKDDGRVAFINLTEKGRLEAKKAYEFSLSIVKTLIQQLGIEQIDAFIKTASNIKNVLDRFDLRK
jgi:DNA-binding MarR family transcriptional regulator